MYGKYINRSIIVKNQTVNGKYINRSIIVKNQTVK